MHTTYNTNQTIFGQQTVINLSETLLFTQQCKTDHEAEQLFYFGGTFNCYIDDNYYEIKAPVCFAQQNEKITLAWFDKAKEKFNHIEIIVDREKVHKHNILAQIDLTHFIKLLKKGKN